MCCSFCKLYVDFDEIWNLLLLLDRETKNTTYELFILEITTQDTTTGILDSTIHGLEYCALLYKQAITKTQTLSGCQRCFYGSEAFNKITNTILTHLGVTETHLHSENQKNHSTNSWRWWKRRRKGNRQTHKENSRRHHINQTRVKWTRAIV